MNQSQEQPWLNESWVRTRMLLGDDAMERLSHAHVAVFGIGGVGSFVVEALARSGVGALTLIDHDTIKLSNLNRQIIATHDSLYEYKADAAAARVHSINPSCEVHPRVLRYEDTTREAVFDAPYDYIADCIDLIKCKIDLITTALSRQIPILSAMGTGNKLNPFSMRIADLSETEGCPLARIMRRELRERGILHTKVIFSPEQAVKPHFSVENDPGRRTTPASCAWVPSVAGLMMGGYIIQDLVSVS